MVYNNILEAIGNTPLIKLNRMTDDTMADIYVKYEGLNVGGSIKTRTAYNMILQAEKDGLLNKDSIIKVMLYYTGGKQTCLYFWRNRASKAICYINILKKIAQE